MGYMTNFKIYKYDGSDVTDDELQTLHNIAGYEFEPFTTYARLDGAKWYDCDNNMIELSKLYPEIMWVVEGDGEESDDYWQTHYYRGKSHSVTGYIAYPPPDLEALGFEETIEPNEKVKRKLA